jgi:hypothetical protein
MAGLLRVSCCVTLLWFGVVPALSQPAPSKPRSPGEIAAADRIAMEKRANCQREARALKLSYFKRLRYVKECVKR